MPAMPKILRYASKYVGTMETAANRGAMIDEWLINAGAALGQPWCAAFAYSVCREAGYRPDVRYPASVRSWYAWAVEHKRIVNKPQPGDIVLYSWDDDGSTDDHIGFVVSAVMAPGVAKLKTIEGNTRAQGAKRDGVLRRSRVCRRNRVVFVRL